ncbi:2-polyprenyl-3-methyl-6-methoxy-1,4-benzoquinone monooxygenase [Ectothiorhodospiraceae bacterium 2226]|nr:2-polyprenyl-3-methyl-6-methoxy-1,4-benzoquinone monooxygenase [Ectothiorhodospiraceae bacterium 2226]
MNTRQYSFLDHLIGNLDMGLRTLTGSTPPHRPSPATGHAETPLAPHLRAHVGRLMRVNHAGEVAAQGLYQGQALVARREALREHLEHAAQEENDHLGWCRERAAECGERTSLLDPAWYAGALAIGAAAGLAGDRWSLGFVAETERQVGRHLEHHMSQVPPEDQRSHAVLAQMHADEARHGAEAMRAGGRELPRPVRWLMGLSSKVMTRTAYWI